MTKSTKKINDYTLDWGELAFGSKKPLKDLNAIFIVAPREISTRRFAQLVKQYFPHGNIVLGLAKEQFVDDLENQPQFRTYQMNEVLEDLITQVNGASPKRKIYVLNYFQRELKFILDKGNFSRVLLLNGSWYRAFHYRPEYYILTQKQIPYELLSPFADEHEAQAFADAVVLPELPGEGVMTELEMLQVAGQAATHSFDYGGYQCGATLGRKAEAGYTLLVAAHNRIVPFETYAMHYGASREKNFSPMQDLNHYDTVHAETEIIIKAAADKIDLKGTTLFINLLPCPTCARMLADTPIEEIVYTEDHSSGYAIQMLEKAGKKVRRVVPAPKTEGEE
ncbi:MAG TPA: deaminase [Candidatus Saccharimonadales bacterium]